jgi:SAM-dependent methyltransferase
MRERAEAAIGAEGLSDRITLVPATLQELADVPPGTFDVIICHAVLEWLADPRQGLMALVPLLAADGQLSLLFYNRHAAFLLRSEIGVALQELEGDWQPCGRAQAGCPWQRPRSGPGWQSLILVLWSAPRAVFGSSMTTAHHLTCERVAQPGMDQGVG